ncbi:MAG TPA: hypothetical protein VMG08_14305 [Allosphingosinicella sp.]|nr:hypothetical protein [Allosphingosinicella sp.]
MTKNEDVAVRVTEYEVCATGLNEDVIPIAAPKGVRRHVSDQEIVAIATHQGVGPSGEHAGTGDEHVVTGRADEIVYAGPIIDIKRVRARGANQKCGACCCRFQIELFRGIIISCADSQIGAGDRLLGRT